MRQNVRSTREFIKSNKVRSTHQSPPIEEQTNPKGRMNIRSTKSRKVEDLKWLRDGRKELVGGEQRR
jgi:hypothetical protein